MKFVRLQKKPTAKEPKAKAKASELFPSLMDRTIAAQQAFRARNDWRSQIRDTDARAQHFLSQHLQSQRNRYY